MDEDPVQKHLRENEERLTRRNNAIARDQRLHREARRRYEALFDHALATTYNCDHAESVLLVIDPTEYRGIAIDGGEERRCANTHCNQLLEFVS